MIISKEEYDILIEISQTGAPDRDLNFDIAIRTMIKEKLIAPHISGENETAMLYHGFDILPLGKRAMEEYEANIEKKELESKTLEIAQESNDLSKRANALSEEANQIAKGAKNISGGALLVSIISAIIALVSIFIAFIV